MFGRGYLSIFIHFNNFAVVLYYCSMIHQNKFI